MSGREWLLYRQRITGFLQIFFLPACCRESFPPRKALAGASALSPPLYGPSVWDRPPPVFLRGTRNLSASTRCLPFLYPPDCAKTVGSVLTATPAPASAHHREETPV